MAGAYSTHTLHKIVSVNPISYGISIPAMREREREREVYYNMIQVTINSCFTTKGT